VRKIDEEKSSLRHSSFVGFTDDGGLNLKASLTLTGGNAVVDRLLAIAYRRIRTMKKSPWHSIKQNVYHNDTDCNTGNNIERENIRQGTGGKPLCAECARLPR
jgi:hypothetical protein